MRLPTTALAISALASASTSLAIVYVDLNAPGPTHDGTSWDTAFLTIQQGVDAPLAQNLDHSIDGVTLADPAEVDPNAAMPDASGT